MKWIGTLCDKITQKERKLREREKLQEENQETNQVVTKIDVSSQYESFLRMVKQNRQIVKAIKNQHYGVHIDRHLPCKDIYPHAHYPWHYPWHYPLQPYHRSLISSKRGLGNLIELKITRAILLPRMIHKLSTAIGQSKALQSLSLIECKFVTKDGDDASVEGVLQNLPKSLRSIRINNCDQLFDSDSTFMEALTKQHSQGQLPELREIDLSNNTWSLNAIMRLAEFIGGGRYPETVAPLHLHVGYMRSPISYSGCSYKSIILEALKHSRMITSINLDGIYMQNDDLATVGSILRQNTTLKGMSLVPRPCRDYRGSSYNVDGLRHILNLG